MLEAESLPAMADEVPWWRRAVFYQVYPRSFRDGSGDGVGDLPGLISALDYLERLGVDAIWLSPVYPSPMRDFGYDVTDHCAVDPVFGSLADLDRVVEGAHTHGIRVLLDWVPNHTSDLHPWFVESRRSRDARTRDWYVWRDGRDGLPPNNWRSAFGGPSWTWDEATAQWYLHLFLPEQPDLNWANAEVRAAMAGTLRFWLDRGVDGFRIDVVHCIGKDPLLPDQPPEFGDVDRVGIHDHPGTHALIREIRSVVDEYDDRAIVGEVNLRDTIRIAAYYGAGDELHLAFNFLSLDARWGGNDWRSLVRAVGEGLGESAWPTWVLSNHDTPRHRTRFGGSERRARAAAVLLLSLRGSPFVYAGEELGLEDAVVALADRVDPGGRDGCRAPLPWTVAPPHGWPGGHWQPFAPDPGERSVEAQEAAPDSILNLYRRLIAVRRASPALLVGSLELLEAPTDVLLFERAHANDIRVVAVSFASEARSIGYEGWEVDVSSDPEPRRRFNGMLARDEAVVLSRPRRARGGTSGIRGGGKRSSHDGRRTA
jgi:alpha-glucosidase